MPGTVAIMQPYAFPYVGYFSLVEASDTFVFYDDVNFIQRGWINRNQILINGSPFKFTIPLVNTSQNRWIAATQLYEFSEFRKKFIKQIHEAYRKAQNLDAGMYYIEQSLNPELTSIADIAVSTIIEFYNLIGMPKTFLRSSKSFAKLKGSDRADRLIRITKALNSSHYINALGGTSLYDKDFFRKNGISLEFVQPRLKEYPQAGSKTFIPGLSIIDVLMNNTLDDTRNLIQEYVLI